MNIYKTRNKNINFLLASKVKDRLEHGNSLNLEKLSKSETIEDSIARKIERSLQLGYGWLDQDRHADRDDLYRVIEAISDFTPDELTVLKSHINRIKNSRCG